jgi:hypothetical protein
VRAQSVKNINAIVAQLRKNIASTRLRRCESKF